MLIRLLLLLLLVWIVAKVLRGLAVLAPRRPAAGPRTPRSPGRVSGGELVQDPHCGVYVPRETALSAGGHYFCSQACREAFSAKRGSG